MEMDAATAEAIAGMYAEMELDSEGDTAFVDKDNSSDEDFQPNRKAKKKGKAAKKKKSKQASKSKAKPKPKAKAKPDTNSVKPDSDMNDNDCSDVTAASADSTQPNTTNQTNQTQPPINSDTNATSKGGNNTKNNRKRKFKEISNSTKNGNNNSNNGSSKENSVEDGSAPPKAKRSKRDWSTEEHDKFVKGLELFGRNWKQIAEYVGTREPASIRSHTQVHLMKMLANSTPLPPKVLESGNGYTLSGKPLNKYSSSVRRVFPNPADVPMVDGVISDEEAANSKRVTKNRKNPDGTPYVPPPKPAKQKKEKPPPKKKGRKKANRYDDSDEDEYFAPVAAAVGKREKRPQRERKSRRQLDKVYAQAMDDPFQLRSDMEYYSPYQSGRLQPQPFKIEWDVSALLVADLHAHLCQEHEIMGFLAGTYDAESRVARITHCYPLREESQSEREVQADPIEQLQVLSTITESSPNTQVLGWYHSHPNFENYPSNRDLEQHCAHKHGEDELQKPYIGLIVASWSSVEPVSEFRWFNVIKERDGELLPMQFRTEQILQTSLDDDAIFTQLSQLVSRYSESRYNNIRTDFSAVWVPNRDAERIAPKNDTSTASDGDSILSITRCEKIEVSLRTRMEWALASTQSSTPNNENKDNNAESGDNTAVTTDAASDNDNDTTIAGADSTTAVNIEKQSNLNIDALVDRIMALFKKNPQLWWKDRIEGSVGTESTAESLDSAASLEV